MNTSIQNPLLSSARPFRFDLVEASHVEPAIDALLAHAEADLDALIAEPGPRTYANTLAALDTLTEPVETAMGIIDHLEGLLDDPALRAAHGKVQPKVSAFSSSLPLNAGLFAAIIAFGETDEASALDPVRRRLLDRTLEDFRRHGAELADADKTQLAALEVKLAEITTRFAQNVVDATDAWQHLVTDDALLAGLPESALAAAAASAAQVEAEGWRFTLHAPSYIAVMTHLDDPALREKIYRAYNTRSTAAPFDNRPFLAQILALRAEKAALLGYADVADLHLEPRMVKRGAAAAEFVADLEAKTRPFFDAEQAALTGFRAKLEGTDAALTPWDVSYYAQKERKALYDFDPEALRPYFPADRVLSGMYELVERLYGVKVTAVDDVPTWHPAVKTYAVDDEAGVRLGVFYADLFPRPGKRGGAWMRPLSLGAPGPDGEPHYGLMCANLTPPVDGKPALLTHREVETLFHEFGHLLHHLLTRITVRSLAGTNVAWDFVELPSQIMENWCWARPALDLFARHYATDANIPDALFEAMSRARTFRAGSDQMRQLSFGTVDLCLHREYDPATDGEPLDYARAVMGRFSPTPLPDDFAMIAAFTHLFASPVAYAAGYYSYKWAEVLDADAFTRFEREGLFSREVGEAFLTHILSAGDSADPAILFERFMGRAPDPDALLRRAGLAGAPQSGATQ